MRDKFGSDYRVAEAAGIKYLVDVKYGVTGWELNGKTFLGEQMDGAASMFFTIEGGKLVKGVQYRVTADQLKAAQDAIAQGEPAPLPKTLLAADLRWVWDLGDKVVVSIEFAGISRLNGLLTSVPVGTEGTVTGLLTEDPGSVEVEWHLEGGDEVIDAPSGSLVLDQ